MPQHLAGAVLLAVAAAFLAAGLRARRRKRVVSPRLAAVGEFMRPLAWIVAGYVGLKATLIWVAFDAGTVFSALDLAGFLAFLASYAAWIGLRTRAATIAPAVDDVPRTEPARAAEAVRMDASGPPTRMAA
ncbi:MAG: hypothetical protein JO048_08355 [Methylobacteriaceae bacterium]|nr:hypothetical protein [Methylobacteriaceae bacterium]